MSGELVGVDDRVDGENAFAVRGNRQRGRQPLAVAQAQPGFAVDGGDLDGAIRRPELLAESDNEPGDTLRADDRYWCGARLAAAVCRPTGIGREQRQQRLLVARFHGCYKRVEQRRLCRFGRVEPLAIAADSLARAVDDLPARRLAALEDRRNLAVADVEHVVQQKDRKSTRL